MSLVTPIPQQTDIVAYAGIPWDKSLENIRLFDSEQQRNAWFRNKVVAAWDNCSIVDIGKKIRVQGYVNNLLKVNYIVFQNNPGMANMRSIYAWVTSVNYINVNTTEFEYEVDWIQTYLFDFQYESCMVEREHVNDDSRGKNTLEENLETGEYIIRNTRSIGYSPAVFTYFLDKNQSSVTAINGVVSALSYESYTLEQLGVLQTFLEAYAATPELIVQMCMGVSAMRGSGGFKENKSVSVTQGFANNQETAYIPRNNKLNCYPFRVVTMDNYMGEVEQLRYEEFASDSTMTFQVTGSAVPKPCMQLSPIGYKGVTSTEGGFNAVDQINVQYNNFPAVPYATDAFRAWVSQYGFSKAVTTGASVVTSLASMVFGGGVGLAVGGKQLAETALDTYQDVKDHKLHSKQAHGDISNAGLQFSRDEVGFRVTQYAIRREYAERIDKFFDRYGYKVMEVKVPNIYGRQYVNYVKCQSGHVGGDIPTDAKLAMERALTQGTSFWHVDDIDMVLTSNPIV